MEKKEFVLALSVTLMMILAPISCSPNSQPLRTPEVISLPTPELTATGMPTMAATSDMAPSPSAMAWQHVVVLRLDWDAGHKVITSTEAITVTEQHIILEMRDGDGGVVVRQTQPVTDCQVVYGVTGLPTGICGTEAIFTVTLPYRGRFEEWVQGEFIAENGKMYTYTVPAVPSLGTDDAGFTLIGVVGEEWYDLCPLNPPTLTPLPTATDYPIQLTYTPAVTPTCRFTATPPPPQATLTPKPSPTLYPTQLPYPPQP